MSDLPEQKVMEQIQKLLNLAAKNPNEHEAAQAAAKAQELLSRYNLDVSTIEKAADAKAGKREQAMVDGGTYAYQRELWKAVAELNYCVHWVQPYRVFTKSKRVGTGKDRFTTEGHVTKQRHMIVGRMVNTQATIALAQYLQAAIERVTLERLGLRHNLQISGQAISSDLNAQRFSNWAVSFRKGCAKRVLEQLQDKRSMILAAEAKKTRADEARAKRAGISTATGMTLKELSKAEREANYDFMYGEGEWAALQARRAEAAKKAKEEQAAYTRWAKAHPEEARAKEEEERKKARSYRGGWGSGPRDTTDHSAFWSGYDEAKDISLDQQVNQTKATARLK